VLYTIHHQIFEYLHQAGAVHERNALRAIAEHFDPHAGIGGAGGAGVNGQFHDVLQTARLKIDRPCFSVF